MKEENNEKIFPLIALRGVVVFPKGVVSIEVARKKSINAIKQAIEKDKKIFLVTQNILSVYDPEKTDLYSIGTVCEIKQFHKISSNEYKLLVCGEYKAKIKEFFKNEDMFCAKITKITEKLNIKEDEKYQAIMRSIKKKFVSYCSIVNITGKEFLNVIKLEQDAVKLFTAIIGIIPIKFSIKQDMLEQDKIEKKLQLLLKALTNEVFIAKIEKNMIKRIEERIDENQKKYFLKEQVKAIQEELGENENGISSESAYYINEVTNIKEMPLSVKEKLFEEIKQLEKMPEFSHESYIITNYLDTVLKLPWDKRTNEEIKIDKATKILDKNHFGLTKVKERIIENLAVRNFNPKIKGQIICLVGPPGVGKTSIVKSIASAIGRQFVRISLGGITDESDIRGHKKTYVGAMPGRIINAVIKSKYKNPLILLDEIDKMGTSYKGDPSAAMLEVLDSEQNFEFIDHFIEVPFDLSECFFIATANSISNIPDALVNRMEIINLVSYTAEEKFHIAKKHLWPKQKERTGLQEQDIKISDSAIYEIIEGYTKEAGVRKLERMLISLLRKSAKKLLDEKDSKIRFTEKNIKDYLGSRKYTNEKISKTDEVGLVNGLAWTSVGGELMQIEAGIMDGKGTVQLTGNLGDIMKESANTAISFVRSVAEKYNISTNFYKTKDIHIHVPEGAVPKDGPSAGIALETVLVSALSNIPVRKDIAMTGEISLRGRVLPIGGLKEKAMAAYKSGITTVLIPQDNIQDLEEVDDIVKKSIEFIPCKTAIQVLDHALKKEESKKEIKKNKRSV